MHCCEQRRVAPAINYTIAAAYQPKDCLRSVHIALTLGGVLRYFAGMLAAMPLTLLAACAATAGDNRGSSTPPFRLAYTTYTDEAGVVVQVAEGTLHGGPPRLRRMPSSFQATPGAQASWRWRPAATRSHSSYGEQVRFARQIQIRNSGGAAGLLRRGLLPGGAAPRPLLLCRVAPAVLGSRCGRRTGSTLRLSPRRPGAPGISLL